MSDSKSWVKRSVWALAALSACGVPSREGSEAKRSLASTSTLANAEPETRSRWSASKEITATEEAFLSPGEALSLVGRELRARLPKSNDEATTIRVGEEIFSLRLAGAERAPATLAQGKLVYKNALPHSIDRVITASDYFMEEFLLLPSKESGTSFSWTIESTTHTDSVRDDGEGGLYFARGEHEAALHVSRPYAIDAHGTKQLADLGWDPTSHALTVTLHNADALTYPLLLDPTFEVALWTEAVAGRLSFSTAMVFDSWRGEVFQVGVDKSYFFNGSWRSAAMNTPGARTFFSLAFDTEHGTAVLFGGDAGGPLSETWIWDGKAWTLKTPALSPAARRGAAMAYDPVRKKVFLFGGENGIDTFDDTWSWDGSAWTKLTTATTPGQRTQAAMTFDEKRGLMVLQGGGTLASPNRSDTWTFDGTTWTEIPDATIPARHGAAMTYDPIRQKIVLFGGANSSTVMSDTWTLDGATWTEVFPATSPSARQLASVAFDPERKVVLLQGGVKTIAGFFQVNDSETWTWNGTTWTKIPDPTAFPRVYQAVAYDGNMKKPIVFGGTPSNTAATGSKNETWAVSPTAYTLLAPPTSPTATQVAGLVRDTSKEELLLFGGATAAGATLNETWGWNGATWTKKTPVNSPPAMPGPVMAYDAVRNQTVLFGETLPGNTATNATWIWDGTNWAKVSPAHSPPARLGHTLAFDAKRGNVVLFGGAAADGTLTSLLDDTWVWDGTDWTMKTPAAKPSARGLHTMTYDSARGLVLVWGGLSQRDTWAWDGTTWTQIAIFGPPSRWIATMAYDETLRQTVLLGGSVLGAITFSDTWWLRLSGGACTADSQCDTEHCVDGVCCKVSGCGTCQACNVKGYEGQCATVTSAEDTDTCSRLKACDAVGLCKKNIGATCDSASECASNFCVDGVCCSTDCKGFCQACRADLKTSGESGTCGVAKEGVDPHNDCPDDQAVSCERDGTCDGSGRCKYYAKGTSCGPSVCASNRAVGRVCDGIGACNDSTDGVECSPFVCDLAKGACTNTCSRDADCTELARCDIKSGKCITKEGSSCDGDHTIVSPAGSKTDCGTYKCEGSTCKTGCTSIADCVTPAVCSVDGTCILDGTSAGETGDSGCSCTTVRSDRPSTTSLIAVFASAMLGVSARRRSRRSR